jgi:hypothetical protein
MKCLSRVIFLLLVFHVDPHDYLAATSVSYDGRTLSLTAENQSFGQVMNLLQQETGLQFEIPGDLQAVRLPLVEISNLSVREALLKLLQGSNYDYILIAAPGNPDQVQKLLVPGKSTKIAAASSAFKAASRPPVEDPFSGGAEATFDDNPAVQQEPAVINAQPPGQGAVPGQPGVQPGVQPQPGTQPGVPPVPTNPNQPPMPGSIFPQQQPQQQQQQQQQQPQGLQPFNPFGNQNNKRSPY